jgi:hypothetical protein
MRSRLGLGFLIVVTSCLAFTATASACQDVHLVLPDSAGPGDTVSYSIAGISNGATYSFTIAGKEISGANTSSDPAVNGVSGTFTMPNLGSQQLTLTANGTCSCPEDANPQNINASMQYVPPPPVQAPKRPAASEPGATPQPAAQSPRAHSHRSDRPAAPVAVAKHAAKTRDSSPSIGTPTGAPTADSVGSGPKPRQPSSRSGQATHQTSEASSTPHKVLHALTSSTRVGPADVPTIGLLLIAVIVIAGAALAAFVIYLLRRGPDPEAAIKAPGPIDPDPVEAELQEMIADEMARQLLSDLDLGERTLTRR